MEVESEENMVEEPQALPWYRNPDTHHPFRLYKKLVIEGIEPDSLQTFTFFPWDDDSLRTLWEGSLATEENLQKWRSMLDKFRDAIVVCGKTELFIVWLRRRKHPLKIAIPEATEVKLIHPDKTHAAWVLSPNAIDEPCVVFSNGSLVWIYNPIHKGLSSYLRGHGGAITSLVVHPLVPNLFCSTSRDHTTRIYDLTLTPHRGFKDRDVNPHWPPGTLPSRAGAPHGLHANEPEGEGIGRCIVVLQGGRSGGHDAAVLSASFHPSYPVIATCGMDRRVKIWHIHPRNSKQITREDKPLFSSSRIHRSRVLSVRWVTHDTLISHCPSAIQRTDPLDYERKDTYLFPGEIVVWKWLGLNRFFPPLYDELRAQGKPQSVLRGCASDYQESSSFMMLASASFPDCRLQLIPPSVNLYNSPAHDPLAVIVIPAGIPYFKGLQGSEDKEGKSQQSSRKKTNAADNTKEDDSTKSQESNQHSDKTESFLPPDEPPLLTKNMSNGDVKRFVGTVTLTHVPSLPLRFSTRHPLDKPTNSMSGAPNGAGDPEPRLHGLSTINPGLIERDPPPPILGWTLEIPLDDDDLVYENPLAPGTAGHAMQAVEAMGAGSSSGKGKAKESSLPETKEYEEQPVKVRLLTAAMGMCGKVIVVLGTRGRIWVYRIRS